MIFIFVIIMCIVSILVYQSHPMLGWAISVSNFLFVLINSNRDKFNVSKNGFYKDVFDDKNHRCGNCSNVYKTKVGCRVFYILGIEIHRREQFRNQHCPRCGCINVNRNSKKKSNGVIEWFKSFSLNRYESNNVIQDTKIVEQSGSDMIITTDERGAKTTLTKGKVISKTKKIESKDEKVFVPNEGGDKIKRFNTNKDNNLQSIHKALENEQNKEDEGVENEEKENEKVEYEKEKDEKERIPLDDRIF